MSISTCSDKCGYHQVLKCYARKLISSVVAYVANSPLDALVCLRWWVVFSLVCCSASLFGSVKAAKVEMKVISVH